MDMPALSLIPTRSEAPQRPRPDAEIAFGGEVSYLPLALSRHSITSSARAKQSAIFVPCFALHLFRGVVRLTHYRRCHARVQRAEIFVGAGLSESEGEAIVGVERPRLKQLGHRG